MNYGECETYGKRIRIPLFKKKEGYINIPIRFSLNKYDNNEEED